MPAWLVAITYLAASAGGIAGNVYWETTLQAQVPNDLLSRVTAYDWFSSLAADPAGYAVTGILVAHFGAAGPEWWLLAASAVNAAPRQPITCRQWPTSITNPT